MGPRYAPPDPSLPKPWRALIDDNTGYLYFWNPETNVTQYQKPTAHPPPKSDSKPKSEAEGEADEGENHHQQPHIRNDDVMDSGIPRHQVIFLHFIHIFFFKLSLSMFVDVLDMHCHHTSQKKRKKNP